MDVKLIEGAYASFAGSGGATQMSRTKGMKSASPAKIKAINKRAKAGGAISEGEMAQLNREAARRRKAKKASAAKKAVSGAKRATGGRKLAKKAAPKKATGRTLSKSKRR